MKIIEQLRLFWQKRTGEEETPFDGDAPAWFVSFVFHLGLLLAIGLYGFMGSDKPVALILTAYDPLEEIDEKAIEFFPSPEPMEDIGANSFNGDTMAFSEAPIVLDVSVVPTPEMIESDFAEVDMVVSFEQAIGLNFNENLAVRGATGVGTTGAVGAIDRITQEILLSLEERKTLVVWVFDKSGSLAMQRDEILERFDRIYKELGVIEASGNPAFSRHTDKPLLTSVVAFGDNVELLTERPTDDLAEIKEIVNGIEQDDSGVEKVFEAVSKTADSFRSYRTVNRSTGQPERNVMVIVFTDEAGDDVDGLELTVDMCRRYEMPVYVIGIPSPFGRREARVKWIDRGFEGDQRPQWGMVDQGPESLMLERLKLDFADKEGESPIDSGFGPFALTRLCYETGGIYFAVHPNRNISRSIGQRETAPFSSHIEHFFDPSVMRRYRPDYVSVDEYRSRVSQHKCRAALVEAAHMSWLEPMESPRMRFVKRDEASFGNSLTEAQKVGARLEPKIERLYQMLALGEADREQETIARWKAGYDLAMGRVLAYKVRTVGYNLMLAAAKRNDLPHEEENSNTWTLRRNAEISTGSQLERISSQATMYLQRVVDNHPGTPWAMLAERELAIPLGWKWQESFTDLSPRNNGGGGGGNPPPNDDELNMLEPRPQPARVPKL